MGWWTSRKPGMNRQVVFFMVDLSGHSQWARKATSDITTAEQRAVFAMVLKYAVRRAGFDCLHWLGDGGLFARCYEDVEDAERICEAAERTFHWFEQWCDMYKLNDELALRVAGTFDGNVYIDPEPGNWFSTEMNLFLKYERRFTFPDAFVITEGLLRKMHPDRHEYKSFGKPLRIDLPGIPKVTITTWAHKEHPREIQESPMRFGKWLLERIDEEVLPKGFLSDKEIEPLHQIGRSVILDSSLTLDGYSRIELVRLGAGEDFAKSSILPEDYDTWRQSRDALAHMLGTKLSVVRFRGELKDDPVVRVQWRDADYANVRAFHDILEENIGASKRYLKDARRVTQEGMSLPNTLSNHIVVLLKNGVGGRDVLIAHRRKGGRKGTWFANRWSFSIEEQYNPVFLELSSGVILEQDGSVHDSIRRGVTEELLGDGFKDDIQVGVYAFQMESIIVNYGFLAIVDLPHTTFHELVERWENAIDREEHDVIAALPLEPDRLRKCLASDSLSTPLWEEIVKSGNRYGEDLEPTDHRWHPTSHVRMALAWWYQSVHRL